MNRWIRGTAVLPLLAWGLSAQDNAQLDAAKKKLDEMQSNLRMNLVGAIKGQPVKGMPYSADEITENSHTLADGTRIHQESKAAVYRDSEGRTRRETPDSITITDPVAGTTYVVNPKTNTVRKMTMQNSVMYRTQGDVAPRTTGTATFSVTSNGAGPANIVVNGKQLDPKAVEEMMAKAKAEGRVEMGKDTIFTEHIGVGIGTGVGGATVVTGDVGGVAVGGARGGVMMAAPVRTRLGGTSEALGKKNVEGVIAEGTRSVTTIPANEIGNDRPIQIVGERWYSEELGMTVMTTHNDPRTGQETFRMTNIRRGDPPAYLFQPPAGATDDRK
jgi:hypothetical protein